MNPYPNDKDSIIFSKIDLTIQLNSNGYLSSITYDEEYSIEVEAPVIGLDNQKVLAKITEKYTYNN